MQTQIRTDVSVGVVFREILQLDVRQADNGEESELITEATLKQRLLHTNTNTNAHV